MKYFDSCAFCCPPGFWFASRMDTAAIPIIAGETRFGRKQSSAFSSRFTLLWRLQVGHFCTSPADISLFKCSLPTPYVGDVYIYRVDNVLQCVLSASTVSPLSARSVHAADVLRNLHVIVTRGDLLSVLARNKQQHDISTTDCNTFVTMASIQRPHSREMSQPGVMMSTQDALNLVCCSCHVTSCCTPLISTLVPHLSSQCI